MGHGILHRSVFGREFLGADIESVLLVLHQTVQPELCGAEHGGEGSAQELLVKRIAIVLPQMGAIPCVGNYILVHESAHTTEDVVLGIAGPSSFLTRILGIALP